MEVPPRTRSWESASESDWEVALSREVVIRPLFERRAASQEAVADAMRRLGASRSLVFRLIARYRQRPQASSLLTLRRGQTQSAKLLKPAREALIDAVIKDFYLTPERPSLTDLNREIRRRFVSEGLPVPNNRTVRSRVAAIPQDLAVRRRHGNRGPVTPVLPSTLQFEAPMDVLQIDHTLADVIVVDQQERRPIGRPWLTLAVDVATRMVAGFHVSLEAPSALAVSLVLTHAVLPKEDWLADRELQDYEWPVSGLPTRVHLDNAKEFHSKALTRGCQEYGIVIDHRPPQRPHFGGHVERLIGTVMGAVHLLPGTTFSNTVEKGDYDSEGRSALTLPELEQWLALQILGVYHRTSHSGLGKTPLEAWKDGAEKRQPPRYPGDAAEFFLDFLPAVSRHIQRDGIHFRGILYWSNVLSPWAGRRKDSLLVKYDPRNLARIYVRDPAGRHWPIPYADLRRPPIALWELREAQRRLQESRASDQSEHAIFDTILKQRRLVEVARKARARRKRERIPPREALPSAPELVVTPAKDLKPYPVEIWEEED